MTSSFERTRTSDRTAAAAPPAAAPRAGGARSRTAKSPPTGTRRPGRKQARQQTQRESLPDGFLAVDAAGLLTYLSGSAERLLGKRRDELVGQSVRELMPQALATPFFRGYARVLAEGVPAAFEVYYPPLGVWLEARLYPAGGGVTAYLKDTTQRRQMEEQLAQALAREQVAHIEAQQRRDEAEAARVETESASRRVLQLQVVTDAALSHLAPDELAPAVLDRICDVMGVDSAAILLLTEAGQALTVYAGRGALDDLVEHVRIPPGQGIAGRIATSRQPLIIDDLSAFEVVYPMLRDQLRSVAGVPLVVEGRCIGVLEVGSALPRSFAAEDVRLLQLVGDRIALAIDHGQLYELARAGYAEAEARASELEAAFATIRDGVFVVDRQGNRVRSNQAFRQMLGLSQDPDAATVPPSARSTLLDVRDAEGHPVPPDRLPTARILRGEVLEGPSAVDLTLHAADGRFVEANVTGAPVRTTDDGIVGAVAVYRDVTERRTLERRTQAALQALLGMAEVLVEPRASSATSTASDTDATDKVIRRLAELMRSLLGSRRIGFMALDPQTQYLQPTVHVGWSDEAERQWQWQVQGSRLRLRDVVPAAILRRLRAGEVVVCEAGSLASPIWQPLEASPVLLAPVRGGSRLIGLLGMDYGGDQHRFTREEQVVAGTVAQLCAAVFERERLMREREAAHLAEIASREATRRMELFMAMAGHESKTPLTVIRGYLQIAEQYLGIRLPNVEIAAPLARALHATRESLAHAQQASRQLGGLLEDLLLVSTAQAGRLNMRPEPCDLIAIVSDTVRQLRRMHPTRQVRLRLPTVRRAPIVAHPGRIGQVVSNYLTNAFKYAPHDQPVDVRVQVRVHERTARVSVRDQGPGLPAKDRKAIWEGFHQVAGVERQSDTEAGLGLGLYVCRTIIEQHEGLVGVDSAVGKGSTFWFTLPLAADAI